MGHAIEPDLAGLPEIDLRQLLSLSDDMQEAALRALDWLLRVQTAEVGHLSIIGNRGGMVRRAHRARFDQQPLEAHALLQACLAYLVSVLELHLHAHMNHPQPTDRATPAARRTAPVG